MALRKNSETEKALRLCKNKCIICGWNACTTDGKALVVGAHVMPVTELEVDTYDDIIALCPNHHTEFDAYRFYIEPKTHKVIYIDEDNLYHNSIAKIPYVKDRYLAYRKYLFEEAHNAKKLIHA